MDLQDGIFCFRGEFTFAADLLDGRCSCGEQAGRCIRGREWSGDR